jgi:hypothetical protein
VAVALSFGFLINSITPKLIGINEITAIILKSMIAGNKFVYDKSRNEMVASIPEIAMIWNPNLRPFEAIHVILPPNLSPSMSGISTLMVNNNCKNNMGIAKIKKGRFNVPIMAK